MLARHKILLTLVIFLIPIPNLSDAGVFQISGGIDARYKNTDGSENDIKLEGLFLNFRKIFSDEKGDRIIAVGQIDIEDNFNEIRPYQTYLQYKGPLGRWNLRAGHYILPYGLLADYDTERLLLRTIENINLGIKLDTGMEVLGQTGEYNYALSASQGVGRERLSDVDGNKLVVGRLAWEGEDVTLGLSGLLGNVLADNNGNPYKSRFGLDFTTYVGPLTFRSELDIGKEQGRLVGGGVLLVDYVLSPKWETNFKISHWQQNGPKNFVAAGVSYNVYQRLFLRMANEYEFGKEERNVLSLQIYWDFIKNL